MAKASTNGRRGRPRKKKPESDASGQQRIEGTFDAPTERAVEAAADYDKAVKNVKRARDKLTAAREHLIKVLKEDDLEFVELDEKRCVKLNDEHKESVEVVTRAQALKAKQRAEEAAST